MFFIYEDHKGFYNDEDWELFRLVQQIFFRCCLARQKDKDTDNSDLATNGGSCHIRSLALTLLVPKLEFATGHLLGVRRDGNKLLGPHCCQHSWNRTPNGVIIDATPVGFICAGPVLVPTDPKDAYTQFGGHLYFEEERDPDLDWKDLEVKAQKYADALVLGVKQ